MEEKYSFRSRLEKVHTPIINLCTNRNHDETTIDDSWEIVIPEDAGPVLRTVALDLKDYFQTVMKVNLEVKKVQTVAIESEANIILGTHKQFSADNNKQMKKSNGCSLFCDRKKITISGQDEKAVSRGCYALEDMLNLRKGPFVKSFDITLQNRFSPRMVHSGWELDVYPDKYLNQIAHCGSDSILIFYRRPDTVSKKRIHEINDLIKRAAKFGIGVYLYIHAWRDYDTLHPTDPTAEAYYESFYGNAFKNHPDAAGCVMVGESCAFPSRDPATNGGKGDDKSKPHPGWWPCSDYPDWLRLVQKVIQKYKKDADIVFWTYNWGWAPEEKRLELINNIPSGISLLVTFEMFELLTKGDVKEACADYTIKFEGPGKYFISEAEAAKAKNIKLYAMANTGGLTWDFGVVPYIPVPFQWIKRWQKLMEANKEWGLSGLMESHHYGWSPSYLSKLGNYFSTDQHPDNPEDFLAKLTESDFGSFAAKKLMNAWTLWSESIPLLPATAYDQYGPLRVGPAYPFNFDEKNVQNVPSDPNAYYGNKIIEPLYAPESFFTRQNTGIPIDIMVEHEINSVKELQQKWQKGVNELEAGLPEVCVDGKLEYERIIALGKFIQHTLRTLLNIKLWWQFRTSLKTTTRYETRNSILEDMALIAQDEIENAKETIPIVEQDSRLGWEPTMGYMTDKSRLLWKIEHLEQVLKEEIIVNIKNLNVS